MNVLVTGGTGTLGRHVVMLLRQSGHRARILSRQPRGHVDAVQGDLRTGTGLDKALAGMDAIIHAATGARQSLTSRATDVGGTRRLLDHAREARIKHVVYISIVGIDRIEGYPYYRTKLRAEAIVREGAVPWSILRATQFHDLMELFLGGFTKIPTLAILPFDWQFQPVHAREVAQRLVDVVLSGPVGMLPDFGGPEVRDFKSLAESWLTARKQSRRLINLSLPFKFSKQWAEGLLTCPDHKDGKITFGQYLEEKYPLS
jgi:uncharacterized protein YbjT (DUF2867 family)